MGGAAKSSAARTSASALQSAVTNEVSSFLTHRATKLAGWVMDSTTGVPGSISGSIFFKPIAPHEQANPKVGRPRHLHISNRRSPWPVSCFQSRLRISMY